MIYFLSVIPTVGPAVIRKLRENIYPLSDLLRLPDSFLKGIGLTERQTEAVRAASGQIGRIMDEADRCAERGIRIVTAADPDFPERLLRIPSPPEILFCLGELPPDSVPTAAVIGSRNATNYGLRMAGFIAGELAKAGVAVISGMALGVDGAAHRGALKEGGKSYAVLGNGVNICYPKDNFDIYTAMSGGAGGILSEYAPGTDSLRQNFPARNRIIAGLSDVLIVAEARGLKSGSQITVNDALEQGKDVFAVPGRITDPLSRGCNDLIKNGASILTSPDDVLEAIGLKRNGCLLPRKADVARLSPEEKKIYEMLDEEPCFTASIIERTALSPGAVMRILLKLELDGLITQLSGNYYAAVLK